MKPTKVVRVNDDDDDNNLSPCITSRVLNVFQCWMGGSSTPTLLKQLGTAALEALKLIENTGQTSTGFRIHRVWLQAPSSPDAEWCRARWGTLHQLLILSWCALSFIFCPRRWGAEDLCFPQAPGTSIYTLRWLLDLSLLDLLKEQKGKSSFWVFPGPTGDTDA